VNFVKIVGELVLHETIFCYSEGDAAIWSVFDVERLWMYVQFLGIGDWIIKRC
jgi:hypothetical protein